MKNLLTLVLIIVIYGCEQKEGSSLPEKINTGVLREYLTKSIDSSTDANSKLGYLIDYSLPLRKDYYDTIVDSFIIGNTVYFYIILENPNPLYNRFAVYDSDLTPLLIDKSLNGNIHLEKVNAGRNEFIKADEVYFSKDTLLLNRISLYSINSSDVSLSFRTHAKFTKPGMDFYQDITEINDTLIKTKITSSKKSLINNKEDIFVYNPLTKGYISSQNLFDEFIKKEIKSFNYNPVKEQLIDTNKMNE